LAVLAAAVLAPGTALADGDPGSDVLLFQPLFLEADAGIPVKEQAQLGALLGAARRAGFPIRVAIVAKRFDLGAVTGLWGKPRSYARFLGLELRQAYSGRLLVVMPNGLGFNWPGHDGAGAEQTLARIKITPGGSGLAGAAQTAIRSLASAAGVKLPASGPAQPSAQPSSAVPTPASTPGSNADTVAAIVAVALAAAAGLALLIRRMLRRRAQADSGRPEGGGRPSTSVVAGGTLGVLALVAIAVALIIRPSATSPQVALADNPTLDPGTPLKGPAPDFTLTDQFGRSVSLHSFRGKVVLLAFNDSECTTICPLTTTAMLQAKAMLGAAGDRVQLLGVDANPKATSLEDVFSYSELHGMLHAWHFLTGSLPGLKHVWKQYGIQAAIQGGEIDHTPALFVIDPQGRLSRLFVTTQSYASVSQLGQLLAQAASRVLPGRPPVHSRYSYSHVTGIDPSAKVTVPRAGGGSLSLGPGHARVVLFFATWDRQTTGLAAGLERLGGYNAEARRDHLPPLTAVDEGSVEPPGALARFLGSLPRQLGYPVGIDQSGRIADGYQVEGLPWLMVVSPAGRIAWYDSVAATGWPTTAHLVSRVKEALARAAASPSGIKAALARLGGSPPALAALHQQASKLLGGQSDLAARIRALRGYPIVINAWASWCGACRAEFGLFASASARYGRRVAFLGANITPDSSADARSFLAEHPVSYPSYQNSMSGIGWLVPQGLAGLPTTIFLNSEGKLSYVHAGQYESQGTLDADIQNHALGH
jgi:cytochrome oxidase Cu insertion factor (SCO1/SenC/PrrC family)/thiol-disulfide isomerase/thioredoxin